MCFGREQSHLSADAAHCGRKTREAGSRPHIKANRRSIVYLTVEADFRGPNAAYILARCRFTYDRYHIGPWEPDFAE